MIPTAGRPATLVIDGEVGRIVESDERDGPLAPLLDTAEPRPDADHGTVHSGDGLFTASIPLTVLRQGTIVGARLEVPDPPTRCWLVKDVVRIELTVGKQPDSVSARASERA